MTYILRYAQSKAERGNDNIDDVEYDVFNCLNLGDNFDFLKELKFGAGDGALNFYMFNYLVANPGFLDGRKVCTIMV